jgi:hypothetical protein
MADQGPPAVPARRSARGANPADPAAAVPGPIAPQAQPQPAVAAQAVNPAPANVPPPARYSKTPALYQAGILDFSTKEGASIYSKATAPLAEPFDCETRNLKVFLAQLYIRAFQHGWNVGVLQIPTDPTHPDVTTSLLKDYGQITLKQIHAYESTYINQESRMSQDNLLLFFCLMASLTKEAVNKILLQDKDYTVNDCPSGPALLKIIISESYIDTNATTKFIRESLSSLDTYMRTIDSDIEKFNNYVKGLLRDLEARGETTQDLLTNLFKGYKAASDEKFVEYILSKEDDYDDGDTTITAKHLMDIAVNKYRTRLQAKTWRAPTEAEEKIIALEVKLQSLIKQQKKYKKSVDNKKNKDKSNSKDKPAWMKIPPKTGEANIKSKDSKTYHWCKHHKAWVMHKPEDCRIANANKGNDTKSPNKDTAKPDRDAKKLALSAALAALTDDSDEE